MSQLSKEITGEGQATIVRDKMGRKRNLEAEAAEKRERETKQRELNEKYAKWNKGLVNFLLFLFRFCFSDKFFDFRVLIHAGDNKYPCLIL